MLSANMVSSEGKVTSAYLSNFPCADPDTEEL